MVAAKVRQVVFFLDRSLGADDVRLAMQAAGAAVEIHIDHFSGATTDDVWLRAVGEKGWIVVTKDERIRYRAVERRAIAEARVKTFILVPKRLTGPQNGEILAKAIDKMTRFSVGNQPPFIAKVFRDSTVRLWERPRA